jgi:hypothetical protein
MLVGVSVAIAAAAAALASCGGDEGEESTKCASSADCQRGQVCSAEVCQQVACTATPDCLVNYPLTFCWAEQALCTAIECGVVGAGPCPAGTECAGYFCNPVAPECENSAQCKQPIEKCLDGKCVPASYCEKNEDCIISGQCDVETNTCLGLETPDAVEVGEEEDTTVDPTCNPNDYPTPVSYLCAACEDNGDCGCGKGKCVEIGAGSFCTTACGEDLPCASGYTCGEGLCKPLGGTCKGCIQPPGCEKPGDTCNFKSGECVAKLGWCSPCTFDYECGFGNRCHKDETNTIYCAPECDAGTFSCPKGSGCKLRDDGLYICEPVGAVCCYGVSCGTCSCAPPTPLCTEDNECVQCLSAADCPPGKPTCDPQTFSCIIQCLNPTPNYWKDPETGIEYCVECYKTTQCPAGYLCGTFKNEPETYHKCYPAGQ